MSQADVVTIVQDAIYTVLLIAMPMLVIGLVVGVIISILQATTQINEQSLSFVPKLVAVFLTFAFCLPWMLNTMMDFTNRLFNRINSMMR